MAPRRSRYFVVHLTERDDRPSDELRFEVQLLDSRGRARACGYVGEDDTELVVEGEVVPWAVLDAARRQTYGQGDYVNAEGESVRPF